MAPIKGETRRELLHPRAGPPSQSLRLLSPALVFVQACEPQLPKRVVAVDGEDALSLIGSQVEVALSLDGFHHVLELMLSHAQAHEHCRHVMPRAGCLPRLRTSHPGNCDMFERAGVAVVGDLQGILTGLEWSNVAQRGLMLPLLVHRVPEAVVGQNDLD